VNDHPTAGQIAELLDGLQGPQAMNLVAHLLRGCSTCATKTSRAVWPKLEPAPGAYDAAFERAFEAVQAHLETAPAVTRRLPAETGVFSIPDLTSYRL
jgi:hypothetical protein